MSDLSATAAHAALSGQSALALLICVVATIMAAHTLPRYAFRLAGASPTLAGMAHWMAYGLVWLCGLSVALFILHVPVLAFLPLSTVALAVSLGAQQLVANIIDGVILVALGRIKVGQTVAIGDTTGTIIEIHALYLAIVAHNGDRHELPYTVVFNAAITHLSPATVATLQELP